MSNSERIVFVLLLILVGYVFYRAGVTKCQKDHGENPDGLWIIHTKTESKTIPNTL